MNPVVEQLAMTLVALRDAQSHMRVAARGVVEVDRLDMMAFDLERIASEIVDVAKIVQSQSLTR